MSYNLLLDTKLDKFQHWKLVNCEYKDGYLISNDKVFGIEQELVLPNPTKLYFRWEYNILNSKIKDIKIGIQNGSTLNINSKIPKQNKEQKISVIDIAKQEKIKVHLIFESNEQINKIKIQNPTLVDLIYLHKSTWLKWILDKTLIYMDGYSYINEYIESEITPSNIDFKNTNIEQGKIGSILIIDTKIENNLTCDLIPEHYYLVKVDYEDINKFGNIMLQYGQSKSINVDDEQLYLLFKANSENTLKFIANSSDIISYKINIKHILLIDITAMRLLKDDIAYIPFM